MLNKNLFALVTVTMSLLLYSSSSPSQQQKNIGTQGSANPADPNAARAAQLTLNDLRTFTDVFNQIRKNYVEGVDDKTLLDLAINGMLQGLDPHSAYLPTRDYKELDNSAQGRYSGIGVDVRVEDQKIVIKSVIVPSPADSSGLNPGDIITSVDGNPVKGRLLQDAIDELQGEPGTTLTISVLDPAGQEREVELTRESIKLPTLQFELLDQDFGYYRMTFFHRESASDLKQSLDSVKQDGINLRGLILDLRDNPGGVLQPAVEIADGFLNQGLIVSTRGRNARMRMEFTASEGEWLPATPIIVLVDRGTASASEVLAGALQDHRRALIVGERTFGKGSVQSVLPLKNGSGIKLTTARYYTPSGRSIQAEGILPDVVINPAESEEVVDTRIRESDLDRHLVKQSDTEAVAAASKGGLEDDFPLHEALNILQEAGILLGNIEVPAAENPEQEN